LTGAGGFVGRHLAAALGKSHRVIALNRRSTGAVEEIVHDLAQPLSSAHLPPRIDAVIHAAGLVGAEANLSALCHRVNVDASAELAEYAVNAGARRFVFFSTGGVYRASAARLTEDADTGPGDAYGRSKLAAEEIVRGFGGCLAVQVLRPFFPYGPTQRKRLIPSLIEKILNDRPVPLPSESGPIVTPLYVDDLVEFVVRALPLDESFVANLAGDEEVSIRTIADRIGATMKREVRFEIDKTLPSVNWRGDNGLISRLADYTPSVPLRTGLHWTIARDLHAARAISGQPSAAA
jgi:nucleoside-diphosphate-sugar epimerase